ncbi:hypothetical protein FJZ31_41700 [Candidatus Poribacteria bacterium]|nr:hypothetical protein [Candidatus Poribacteria bacterium]
MENINNERFTIDNWRLKIPAGWMWRRLEDCVDILDYLRIPVNSEEREKRKGNIPYYGATGQIGWIDDYLFDEELVLLGEDGAPFFDKFKKAAYIISGKSWVNNHAHVLRALSSITSNHFICHYLNQFDFHGYVTGTTRLKLNQSAMKKIPIPLPPLPEQRLIVYRVEKLLEQVRSAKENLDKVPQIIKRFRQAALKKAFSGELTAEWREKHPDLEPATKLLKRIQDERKKQYEVDRPEQSEGTHENTRKTRKKAEGKKTPTKPKYLESEPLDNSDLPELPEGWVWSRLEEMAQINPRHPANIVPEDAEISFVPMSAIDEKSWKFKEMQTRILGEVRKGYTHFAEGDVLFAKITPCMENGKAAVARNLVNGIGCGTTELHVIRPEGRILPEFIYHYIHQQFFREKAEARMTGTAGQLRVPVNFVKTASIPLSPLPEQKEIVRRVETLFKFADEVERKIERAREQVENITQSVLSKAFRGELTEDFRETVKNWKKLDLEERRKYIFILPEGEQREALYGDKFPLEPAGVLLKRIQEKSGKQEKKEREYRKPELVPLKKGGQGVVKGLFPDKSGCPEPKQLTLWDE